MKFKKLLDILDDHLSEPSQLIQKGDIKDNTSENRESDSSTPTMPFYLIFLRFFAVLNFIVGILAFIIFALQLWAVISNSRSVYANYLIISISLMVEGLLAFGILNAIADIAENMIDVGNYVRELRRQNKS